jgi:choline dehydrogenase-like flavoprotein
MNSATDVWEGGLGSSSDALGKNLMDHHLGVGAGGTVEGYEDLYTFGRRANGFYIPRFRNVGSDKRDYLRGFGYQGGGSRQGWQHEVAEFSIGSAFKEAITEPGTWTFGMGGFGEMLPDPTNKVTLDKTVKDKWGLNVLNIDCELKDNELKMSDHGKMQSQKLNKIFTPEQLSIVKTYRFEGMSDPADSAVLYLLEDTDQNMYYISDAYGIYSDNEGPDFDDFLKKIPVANRDEQELFT